MAKKIRVFVYGTLKRGRANNGALEGGTNKFLGLAFITGAYKFVDLGWYPGVIRGEVLPERKIGGEVWEIDLDTLNTLDNIEGHPHFYERIRVPTSLGSHAWVYTLPHTMKYGDKEAVPGLFWKPSDVEEAFANERVQAA
jgi:gamma-glutamylaminecyclotransferase